MPGGAAVLRPAWKYEKPLARLQMTNRNRLSNRKSAYTLVEKESRIQSDRHAILKLLIGKALGYRG